MSDDRTRIRKYPLYAFTSVEVSGQPTVYAKKKSDVLTLIAGSQVSIGSNNSAKTVTIASTAATKSFSTIAVSGQSDVVAEITDDTLTLQAADGLGITTTPGTDTVRLSSGSANIVYASRYTSLDATSGSSGTDNTTALQAILDLASATRPIHLIIDGNALISGLNVKSYTTVELVRGATCWLANGANRAMLRNANRSRGTITDQYITICGNGIWNGNKTNQSGPGATTRQEADGTWIVGMQFAGVNYLTLRDFTVWAALTFAIHINNANRIHLSDLITDVGATTGTVYAGQDGPHFNGPLQYLTARNIKIRSWDDAFALNANDAALDDITGTNPLGPYVGQGAITDVDVQGLQFMGCAAGIRLLSSDQIMDRILIAGVTGTVQDRGAEIGHFINASHGVMRSVTIRDFDVAWGTSNAGAVGISSIHVDGTIENLTLKNIKARVSDTRPVLWLDTDASIGELEADCTIYDSSDQAVPISLVGSVTRARLGLSRQGSSVDTGRAIFTGAGTITELRWVDSPPIFVSAEVGTVDESTLVVTFDKNVTADNYTEGVTVQKNSVTILGGSGLAIDSATRQSDQKVVHYHLPFAIAAGDVVTFAYTEATGNISNLDGQRMKSCAAKTVTNNVVTTVLILDNFTAADSTTINGRTPSPTNTPGGTYSIVSGGMDIQSNRAHGTSVAAENVALIESGLNNLLSVSLIVNTPAGHQCSCGVILRAVNASNFWLLYLSVLGTIKIYKQVSGVFTEKASSSQTYTAGTNYTLRFTVNGSTFTGTVNGTNTITCTGDSALDTATLVGMRSDLDAGSVSQIFGDNFTVTTP